jgi:hypothetical protein
MNVLHALKVLGTRNLAILVEIKIPKELSAVNNALLRLMRHPSLLCVLWKYAITDSGHKFLFGNDTFSITVDLVEELIKRWLRRHWLSVACGSMADANWRCWRNRTPEH